MKTMKHMFVGTMTLAAAWALTAATMSAQRDTTRTPWGHVDLQGVWTNATLTPLERPASLAGKAFYTPEEAAAFERERLEQINVDRAPRRAGEVGAYNDVFFERGKPVRSGRTSLIVDPPDGRIPAFTPEAQQKVDARRAYAPLHPADGPEDRWLTERCLLFGAAVPMLPEPYNSNYRIMQTPDAVVILVEMNHEARMIPLDGRPRLSPAIRQWTGDSRGRWEGDTLVVETTNLKFNHQSRFGVMYLDGLSDGNLRIVERFSRVDANTLTYRATIEDPTVFVRPWTVEMSLSRSRGPMFEVACHEGNYGMRFILSGHRAEERAAAR
jgi:hypothetical protein